MRKTTIELTDEHAEKLDRCRRFENRTMKAVIENALDEYFEEFERQYKNWADDIKARS